MSPMVKSWLFIILIILGMTFGFKKAFTWFFSNTGDAAQTQQQDK